nr:PPC domain-containing protein [Pleurocapsa sp. PCC 7319]
MNLHNITSGDDADLYLYEDSNNNRVFDSSDQQIESSRLGGNMDDSINYLASAGNYFAVVERYAPSSNSRLDYELDLSATPGRPYPALTEPPNLLPNEVDGGVLSRGDQFTYNGWVGDSDTSDVYRFILDRYSNVNVSLTGLSSDADIQLIQDFNDNNIVEAGEVDSNFTSTNGGISDEEFSFSLHGDNPFYVQVYQYTEDTSYQLQVDASY